MISVNTYQLFIWQYQVNCVYFIFLLERPEEFFAGAYHLVTFEAQDTDAGKKLIDQSTAYMYLYIPNETPMELENASNKNISRELMKGVR